jgi:hypothetical protein
MLLNMRSIGRRITPWLWILCLPLASPAAGQVRGTVVDEQRIPLPGVSVELWSGTARLAARITEPSGEFVFSPAETADAVGVLARRIGFRTAQVPLGAGTRELTITLGVDAVALEGVTILATGTDPVCPNRDDPRARSLWNAARSRYSTAQGSFRTTLHLESYAAEVPSDEIGSIEETRLRPGVRTTAASGGGSWNDHSCGYGCRIERSMNPAHAAWRYPALESHYTRHFTSDYFGDNHTFTVAGESATHTVLAFCSTQPRNRVRLEGTLYLTESGAFAEARWMYRTPRPAETAGAEVVFVPIDDFAGEPLLLAAQSLFWRSIHGRKDRFFQRWERYHRWEIHGP